MKAPPAKDLSRFVETEPEKYIKLLNAPEEAARRRKEQEKEARRARHS